jgi:hypothetical protein
MLEEELNKEKNEMRRLLKAKEDLIELQNKRIESLAKQGHNYTQQLKQSIMNANYKKALDAQVQQNQYIQQQTDLFKAFYQPKPALNLNGSSLSAPSHPIIMNRTNPTSQTPTSFIRTSEL